MAKNPRKGWAKKRVGTRRLRSRNVGKVKCVPYKGMEVCAIGRKYGFSVELVGKTGGRLPVHTATLRPRTAQQALREGITWLKQVRKRQGLVP